nr:unnamed protein product [Callosobruchus chinensis]
MNQATNYFPIHLILQI